jgi:hypothetical protein
LLSPILFCMGVPVGSPMVNVSRIFGAIGGGVRHYYKIRVQ